MNDTSRELKRRARQALTGHYGLAMTSFITANLLTLLLNIPFQPDLQNPADGFQITISILASFIISLLSVVLNSGILYIHLQFARGKEAKPADVFRFFGRRPDRFLLAGIFITLCSAICTLPAIGCSIFAFYSKTATAWILMAASWALSVVLTGIFALTFDPIYFLLIDRPDDRIPDILRECRRLMKGKKIRKLCIGLSFLGLIFFSILSLGIGLLWVIPYINQTNTEFYRSIIQES